MYLVNTITLFCLLDCMAEEGGDLSPQNVFCVHTTDERFTRSRPHYSLGRFLHKGHREHLRTKTENE